MDANVSKHGVDSSSTDEPLRRATWFVVLTLGLALSIYLPIIASDRGWLSVSVPASVTALGIFSPTIAALVLLGADRGRAGLEVFVQRATKRRFGARWWLATLLVPPVVIGGSYAAYLLLGGQYQTATTIGLLETSPMPAAIVVPVLVVLTIVLAFGEEAGWRGYLLPLLQARWSALTASLVLGVVWFLWHVPLLYLPGSENAGFPLPVWAVSITVSSIFYTWLFNNTGGSVLAVTLFHAGFNVWGRLVALHPSETGEVLSAYVIAGGNVVVALVIVVVYGGATLTRSRSGTGENDT